MDPYLSLLLMFLAVLLSFSTFIGGFFLWTACQVLDRAWPASAAPQATSSEPERTLKTTDAGPYTAPGTAGDAEQKVPLSGAAPGFLMCCVINSCVCVASFFVGWGVMMSFQKRMDEPLFFWMTGGLAFLIAFFLHTVILQTTLLRGLLITVLVIVPWGATALAFVIICSPRSDPPRPPRPAPAATSHVVRNYLRA